MAEVIDMTPRARKSYQVMQRDRFEEWAKSGMTGPREATTLLARSRGGDYVLAATRAAWAAWQAGIEDMISQYLSDKK